MPGTRLLLTVLAVAMPAGIAGAQGAPADAPAEPGEVTIGEEGANQDPLAGRKPVLSIEPVRDPAVNQVEGVQGVPALRIKVDPRVLGVVPGEPLPRLRREGESLRRRDGQLVPSGERGYAVFIAEADPEAGDDQPVGMVVAPCMMLESMERLLEDRGDDLRFTITGQVHTYRGVNYLLPTTQPKPWLVTRDEGEIVSDDGTAADPDSADTDESPDKPTGGDEPKTTDAAPDGPKGADPDGPRQPTADEVLGELIGQRSDAPDPTATPGGNDGAADGLPPIDGPGGLTDPLLLSLDPDQPQAELKDEGQFIIARTGRLLRSADGSQALFVFDADQAQAPEPPMIMHACKLLETMEATVRKQGDDTPFVVTGQVYVYRGANYLLPTIVKQEFDRGNLK